MHAKEQLQNRQTQNIVRNKNMQQLKLQTFINSNFQKHHGRKHSKILGLMDFSPSCCEENPLTHCK